MRALSPLLRAESLWPIVLNNLQIGAQIFALRRTMLVLQLQCTGSTVARAHSRARAYCTRRQRWLRLLSLPGTASAFCLWIAIGVRLAPCRSCRARVVPSDRLVERWCRALICEIVYSRRTCFLRSRICAGKPAVSRTLTTSGTFESQPQ